MDYKEKYEQALERARQFSEKPYLEDSAGIVEYIFPELKESEDEKTKRILHSISSKMSFHLRDIFTEEEFQCFDTWSNAWLEKQGEQPKKHDVCDNCDQQGSCVSPCPMKLVEKQAEQKPNPVLDIEIPFGAKDSELQEASYHIPEGFHAEIEGNRVVIKRGEQKPNFCHHEVDLSGCSDEYCKAYYDGWNNCNQQHAQLEAEQKPAEWSEEDEINLEKAIWYVGNPAPMVVKDSMLVEWLKSLKDRVQPKQEWSEEDEKILRTIISDGIRGAGFDMVQVDWLKSLKSHSQWKPSDEQMKWFGDILDYHQFSTKGQKIMQSLYDNLKKLKG